MRAGAQAHPGAHAARALARRALWAEAARTCAGLGGAAVAAAACGIDASAALSPARRPVTLQYWSRLGLPLAIGRYKARLYGLPYVVDARIPLYRKDLLAEAGLPPERKRLPKTWEQFRDTAKRLARWEGGRLARVGFDVPKTGDARLFMTLVAQQGKNVYNVEGTKVAFDGAEGQRALQLLVDFVHRDGIDSFQRPPMPSGVEALAAGWSAPPHSRYGEIEARFIEAIGLATQQQQSVAQALAAAAAFANRLLATGQTAECNRG